MNLVSAGDFANFVPFDEFQERQVKRAVFWNVWLFEDKGVQVALFVEIEKAMDPVFPSDEIKELARAYIDAYIAANGAVPFGSLRVPPLNLRFDFYPL